jgi:tRNA threonylcarbamoyladenosine biosynthesis protein TsaB
VCCAEGKFGALYIGVKCPIRGRVTPLSLYSSRMDILALETSTARGTAALWRDGRLMDVRDFQSERAHNAVLFAPLASLLKEVEELECLVCGTGPGSYTGIRVGIAAAIGISIARKAPLIGLPSLLALRHADGLERYAVCGDARRGSWWWAEVENGRLVLPPQTEAAEATAARAAVWPGQIFTTDETSPPFCGATCTSPRAELLASRAGGLSGASIARLAAQPVEPLYLGAAFVTQSKKPVFAPAHV